MKQNGGFFRLLARRNVDNGEWKSSLRWSDAYYENRGWDGIRGGTGTGMTHLMMGACLNQPYMASDQSGKNFPEEKFCPLFAHFTAAIDGFGQEKF